jgi:hypothetical protein
MKNKYPANPVSFAQAIFFTIYALAAVFANAAQIDFSIRFFDKRIYYAETDPIYVQITIANNSPASYHFKLADERAFSVDFDIRTVTNRSLEPADALIRKRTQSQHIFFREITVEPGESFSFVEDLRDYVNLRQPGSFIVQGRVFPELYFPSAYNAINSNLSETILESNRLNLNIRPPFIAGPDGIPLAMDEATGAVLVRKNLAPDQIVEYLLTARQKSQWEEFFLYLDLEAMLSRDPTRRRRWLAAGEDGRRQMIADYRQELRSSVVDRDIATIPSDFTIERTTYNNVEGTVTVLEKFRIGNFTELKRYTYYVAQKDGIWTVVSYSVVNLGTE